MLVMPDNEHLAQSNNVFIRDIPKHARWSYTKDYQTLTVELHGVQNGTRVLVRGGVS
jgi:hypothetical protein